jgi:hypothetical protein
LTASELHPTVWGAAARLWDDGHFARRCRPRRLPSKVCYRAPPVLAFRVKVLPASSTSMIRHPVRPAFGCATSIPLQDLGSQPMRALPHWLGAHSWACVTLCLILAGPAQVLMRLWRCSLCLAM